MSAHDMRYAQKQALSLALHKIFNVQLRLSTAASNVSLTPEAPCQ